MGLPRRNARAIILACCAALVATAQAFAALSPTVSTAYIHDFARLSFQWPEEVRFKLEQSSPQGVTIRFNKPTSVDMGAIRAGLGGNLTGASLSQDGMAVTLSFAKPFRVRHFISGNANGIDLIGASKNASAAAPPAAPEPKPQAKPQAKPIPPAAAPIAKPTTPVQAPPAVAAKPTPAAPKETPKKEQASAATSPAPAAQPQSPTPPTNQPAAPKATQAPVVNLQHQPLSPAQQQAVKAEEPAPTEVAPALAPPATADKPVTNVPAPAPEEKTAAAAKETPPAVATSASEPAAPSAAPVAVAAPTAAAEVIPAAPNSAAAPAEATTQATNSKESEPSSTSAEGAPTAEAPPQAETPAPSQPTAAQASEQETAAQTSSEPAAATEAATTPTPPQATPPLSPPHPDSYTADAASADEQPQGNTVTSTPAVQDGPFLITSNMLPTGVEVNFPWRQRTAAAVFSRGNALWIVFNAKADINLQLFKSILPGSVTDVQMLDNPTHTILVLHTDGSVYAKVTRPTVAMDWVVSLSQYRQIPKVLTAINPRPDLPEPAIQISTLEYSPPITVTDPLVGDELMITPLFTVGEGVYPQRDYPELTLLETAQGIAMVRKADLARIKPQRIGLKVEAQGGISLSANLPQLALDELESLVTQQTIWFPYDSWKSEPGKFIQTRQELDDKIVGAGTIRANSLRLKLAQLYLANGMAAETLGLLNIIQASDPTFYAERQLAAMRGAADFLLDHFTEADTDFRQPELNDRPEQKLWLDALKTLQEDRPRFDFLQYHRAYISKYPPALREKLSVIAADNYINRKSIAKAMATFDTLSETGISPHLMPYIDYLLGKISAENKKYKTAETLWKPLAEQLEDRFIRARAEFSLVSMQYGRGAITLKQAIDRLDRLRVVWRGDSLELSLLNYLGQLYVDDKNYLDGLRAWRELATNFPTSPIVPDVARQMASTFNELFANGKADALEPLQALSIFYEFRDLVPIGDAGDAMIQNLASRLANVDLLDRAAALLEHQIKFRQEKQARSKLASQLALIYLLNKEPEKAIRILEVTGYGENPIELQRERAHLAAMALSETGDVDGALEALTSDTSASGQMLKLDILWQHRRWSDVAQTAESILSQRDDMTRPLTEEETNVLLQLAIAYMFERETAQLQYLRTYFTPLLKEGPDKDIFAYVSDTSGPIDPKKMEDITTQIGRIQDFLKHYRDQVDARPQLSPIPNKPM